MHMCVCTNGVPFLWMRLIAMATEGNLLTTHSHSPAEMTLDLDTNIIMTALPCQAPRSNVPKRKCAPLFSICCSLEACSGWPALTLLTTHYSQSAANHAHDSPRVYFPLKASTQGQIGLNWGGPRTRRNYLFQESAHPFSYTEQELWLPAAYILWEKYSFCNSIVDR